MKKWRSNTYSSTISQPRADRILYFRKKKAKKIQETSSMSQLHEAYMTRVAKIAAARLFAQTFDGEKTGLEFIILRAS
jgi:hypothetical protein